MSELTDISRKLVAVFAADVEGYSRLMGTDEVGTLTGLTERRVILDKIIAEHRGRIANTAGDSVLAEFGSAMDAVKCAVDAQAALAEANANLGPDRRINFRIGVHIGDVMVRAGDLFGDGVNIAARLEALAKPGGVCISGATHDQVRKVLPIAFADLGVQHVKNIQEPIRAYEVITTKEHLAPPVNTENLLPLPDKPSIAVLPFQNMSGDPEQEYFADGMVEDLITALSRFKSLFVIARNSSFAYKGKSPDVRQVGRELGVRYVLEGSVRKAGNKVRITAQLVEAASGNHTWADRFDGALEDIFSLQDEVTQKVVGTIAPRVEQAEVARALRRSSESTDAYDCYLRGLAHMYPVTSENVDRALSLFTTAIAIDPSYASAYGMAIFCHTNRIGFNFARDLDKEQGEIARLLEMIMRVGQDDGVAIAHAAWTVAFVSRDAASAKRLIDRALELNPNLAAAWINSGWINIWLGQPQIGLDHLTLARRFDPTSHGTRMNATAHAYFFLDRYEEALAQAEESLRGSPNNHPALRIGAASAAFAGQTDAAQRLAQQLQTIDTEFRVSRLKDVVGPYKQAAMEKYAEGLRLAGIPE
jgi:TolB-like protein/class 3 adenylate cyclase